MDIGSIFSAAVTFLSNLFGFGGKVQDEKNTAPMRAQKQADQKIAKQTQINESENKAATTGDDADFGAGL